MNSLNIKYYYPKYIREKKNEILHIYIRNVENLMCMLVWLSVSFKLLIKRLLILIGYCLTKNNNNNGYSYIIIVRVVASSSRGRNQGWAKNSEQKNWTEPDPKKTVSNPNRNWLNIWMSSKFWYLENRNRIRSEPKYFGYPIISEIDLYTYLY